MTLDIINDNINNNNPTLHPQQRRIIDLFIVLYGSFRISSATRVNRSSTLISLLVFKTIKDLLASPRKEKVSKSLYTIPVDYTARFGGGQAEEVTLTAEHT
ncbi:transcriptional regulator family: Fungal Specific TF [Penicillium sp. IBT 18751x]|nr:transcriptional regulator family: Fungal Specific TF [Penicillium sp. IBT 18751x]